MNCIAGIADRGKRTFQDRSAGKYNPLHSEGRSVLLDDGFDGVASAIDAVSAHVFHFFSPFLLWFKIWAFLPFLPRKHNLSRYIRRTLCSRDNSVKKTMPA
jgi:hypothetical protein